MAKQNMVYSISPSHRFLQITARSINLTGYDNRRNSFCGASRPSSQLVGAIGYHHYPPHTYVHTPKAPPTCLPTEYCH